MLFILTGSNKAEGACFDHPCNASWQSKKKNKKRKEKRIIRRRKREETARYE